MNELPPPPPNAELKVSPPKWFCYFGMHAWNVCQPFAVVIFTIQKIEKGFSVCAAVLGVGVTFGKAVTVSFK